MDDKDQNDELINYLSLDEINEMFNDVIELSGEEESIRIAYSCAADCGGSPSSK